MVGAARRCQPRRNGPVRDRARQEKQMNTRTMATLALVIAVLLLLFLVILPRL